MMVPPFKSTQSNYSTCDGVMVSVCGVLTDNQYYCRRLPISRESSLWTKQREVIMTSMGADGTNKSLENDL